MFRVNFSHLGAADIAFCQNPRVVQVNQFSSGKNLFIIAIISCENLGLMHHADLSVFHCSKV
jgi:hypothetical protein